MLKGETETEVQVRIDNKQGNINKECTKYTFGQECKYGKTCKCIHKRICKIYATMSATLAQSQIAFQRWSNVGSTLYTTMAHGRHTTLDQCSLDHWRMVG